MDTKKISPAFEGRVVPSASGSQDAEQCKAIVPEFSSTLGKAPAERRLAELLGAASCRVYLGTDRLRESSQARAEGP